MEQILDKVLTDGNMASALLLGALVWVTRQWLKERTDHITALRGQIEQQAAYVRWSENLKGVLDRVVAALDQRAR